MKTPDETPKKRKRGRPKKVKKSEEPIEESLEEDTELVEMEIYLDDPEDVEMLKNIIEKHKQGELQDYNKKCDLMKEATFVKNMLSEHLDGFLVVGYTLDGQRVTIKHTKTDREEDALIEQLRLIFLKLMGEM